MKDLTQGSVVKHLLHMSAFYGREHGGADPLFIGRSLLGGTPRKGSDWGGRRGRQPDDDCARAHPNARRGNNDVDLASRRKEGPAASRGGVQSVFRLALLDSASMSQTT